MSVQIPPTSWTAAPRRPNRDFERAVNPFHRNIRWILDLCFPDIDFSQQMRRTWITESYLCSARVESGPIPARSWRTCARDYLLPQLKLLEDRAIVALGWKARERIRALQRKRTFGGSFLEAKAASPRGLAAARRSWMRIPNYLSERDSTPRPG